MVIAKKKMLEKAAAEGAYVEGKDGGPDQVKCLTCGSLLEVPSNDSSVEIKCPTCGTMTALHRKVEEKVEIKCPKCSLVQEVTSDERPLEMECSACGMKLKLSRRK